MTKYFDPEFQPPLPLVERPASLDVSYHQFHNPISQDEVDDRVYHGYRDLFETAEAILYGLGIGLVLSSVV